MDRRSRSSLVALTTLVTTALYAASAAAGPRDAAATKLNRDAIETDYLAMQFGSAEKKLKQAIALCGTTACAPAVLAQIHRDLAIVYLASNRGADSARAEFMAALNIDPSTTLPKDLATAEATQLFTEVKDAAGTGAGPGTAVAPSSPPPVPGAPTEELAHTPPAQGRISTPLPLYVELAEGFTVAKVQVRYKTPSTTDWKVVELKRLPSGYGVEIPCADVGATAGELTYFIQAVNASEEPIATHGTRNAPHTVPIVAQLTAPAAHFPDKPPPESCVPVCPPGSTTCGPANNAPAPLGGACSQDSTCASGACRDGLCAEAPPAVKACQSQADCDAGQACVNGACGSSSKTDWLSVAIQQEALILPSANGACGVSDARYTCYDGPYLYQPRALDPATDHVQGGLSLATARILIGYDRVVHRNITAGARIGFAFNHGPTEGGSAFFPVHAELRGTYWFGADPMARVGLRPYVLLSGGAAQVDAKRRLTVTDEGPYNLQAWRKTGKGFVAAGGGIMYALSSSSGVSGEIKVLQMLGNSGTGLAGQIGYTLGL